MKIIEGAKIAIDGSKVTVSGAKGSVVRDFTYPEIKISMKGDEIEVSGPKAMMNTTLSHIKNMMLGVTAGYAMKLKIIYAHFPVSVEIKGKEILVKNFIGEKQPRRARIMGSTKVESKGTEMNLSGNSKEDIGQTFANIKSATKIRNRDSRVFQDGFYLVEQ